MPSLAERLASAVGAERDAVLLDVVRSAIAEIVGLPHPEDVDANLQFAEMGFSSLAAVALTSELARVTGLDLEVTIGFQYPTPAAVAGYLRREIDGEPPPDPAAAPADAGDESDGGDPIAIVGMGCRLPGDVSTPEELWSLVIEGRDAVGEFPEDRGWDLEALRRPDGTPGSSTARAGGFLRDAASFDAGFFGISPREALAMDPQQRLLLQVVWEAFEDAGIDPETLRSTPTGVFAGVATHDYEERLAGRDDLEGYVATGSSSSVASGRVAYVFGFEGPAVTVDTACSSSLVALHLACRSIASGESSFAVVGGATVIATPKVYVEFSRQRGLSPDGRCRAYADAANGTGFSEGAVAILIERLSDALRKGHRVLAAVRASALNQDGASNGLTAPSGASQERLIASALRGAGLRERDIDVVEGHGTGTTLGDPIEVRALLASYGQDRPAERPLRLGSLKSNIGHTQAAAGLAGVLKMVMAMRHGVLPPTLHVDAPSSRVDWSKGDVALLTEPVPWPPGSERRRGAVSAFGMSGTNAHVILEDFAEHTEPAAVEDPPAVAWLLSAKTRDALGEQARRLLDVAGSSDVRICDVAHSLRTTRSQLEHRAVVTGATRSELLAGLHALCDAQAAENLAVGRTSDERRVAFLFPGQGAQWVGMGRELLETSAVFARSAERCGRALAPFIDWSLDDVLRGREGAPSLERIDVVQPALFTMMVSLAELWRWLGIEPTAVVGHSQGEIAAACAAGGLTLEDAARIVALRSKSLMKIAGRGGMVSVSLPPDDALRLIDECGPGLSLATVNGPASVVVSGDVERLQALLAACDARAVWARRIPVDYASHSDHVDEIREELRQLLAPTRPQAGQVPFVSSMTGEPMDTLELDAGYWFENLRNPVRTDLAVRHLVARGYRTFVEVSPHPVLTVGVQGLVESLAPRPGECAVLGTLSRDEGGLARLARSAGALHVSGVEVDWSSFTAGSRIELPRYPFAGRRYWASPPLLGAGVAAAGIETTDHPLLVGVIPGRTDDEWLFTGRLAVATHPWLAGHQVAGAILLSGTTFLELALMAARRLACSAIDELVLERPLVLSERGAVDVHLRIGALEDGHRQLAVYARDVTPKLDDPAAWSRHATGSLGVEATSTEPSDLAAPWPPAGATELDVVDLYDRLADRGYAYAGAFRGLRLAWSSDAELYAELALPEEAEEAADRYVLHPALLDAAFHALAVGLEPNGTGSVKVPFAWSDVRVGQSGASRLRVRLRRAEADTVEASAWDDHGRSALAIGEVSLKDLPSATLRQTRSARGGEGLLGLAWEAASPQGGSSRGASQICVVAGAGEALPPFADGVHRYDDLDSAADDVDAAPSRNLVLAYPAPLPATAQHVRRRVAGLLAQLQRFLADERLASARLVVVTQGAVATTDGEAPDLGAASLWGLVRSAQNEHPDRIVLVDAEPATRREQLEAALAAPEPQVAIRGGSARVPRLRPVAADAAEKPAVPARGTVLITGGVGTLGRLIARHLVERHGVKRLLLLSRRGDAAPGARELQTELSELGAAAAIAACDASRYDDLARAIDDVPEAHPLSAVIHAAGVIDDGTIESLTVERVDRVMVPKVDAALNLHALTERMDLDQFVLFSSIAGVVGGPGQGNYAAANAFLDALAAHRRARGLPGLSIAWGLWADESKMTRHLDQPGRASSVIAALEREDALQLFDHALSRREAFIAPARLQRSGLRQLAELGAVPAVLRALAPSVDTDRRSAQLLARLAAASAAVREEILLQAVREAVAAVLGHGAAEHIEVDCPFKDQGMDSLAAVRLRTRLSALTGLRLSSTLAFQYPTPRVLAETLLEQLDLEEPSSAVDVAVDTLASWLSSAPTGEERDAVERRLRALLATPGDATGDREIENATEQELFALLDVEFARSAEGR